MLISLQNLDTVVTQATHPERLRDILILIFREVMMRCDGNQRTQHFSGPLTGAPSGVDFFISVCRIKIRAIHVSCIIHDIVLCYNLRIDEELASS